MCGVLRCCILFLCLGRGKLSGRISCHFYFYDFLFIIRFAYLYAKHLKGIQLQKKEKKKKSFLKTYCIPLESLSEMK